MVVFVHGVFGGAEDTWTNPATRAYWPKLLLDDSAFTGSDVYVYAYSTPYLGQFDDQGWFAKRQPVEALMMLLQQIEREDQASGKSGHPGGPMPCERSCQSPDGQACTVVDTEAAGRTSR